MTTLLPIIRAEDSNAEIGAKQSMYVNEVITHCESKRRVDANEMLQGIRDRCDEREDAAGSMD